MISRAILDTRRFAGSYESFWMYTFLKLFASDLSANQDLTNKMIACPIVSYHSLRCCFMVCVKLFTKEHYLFTRGCMYHATYFIDYVLGIHAGWGIYSCVFSCNNIWMLLSLWIYYAIIFCWLNNVASNVWCKKTCRLIWYLRNCLVFLMVGCPISSC